VGGGGIGAFSLVITCGSIYPIYAQVGDQQFCIHISSMYTLRPSPGLVKKSNRAPLSLQQRERESAGLARYLPNLAEGGGRRDLQRTSSEQLSINIILLLLR